MGLLLRHRSLCSVEIEKMRIDSFNDLEKLGWRRRPNNKRNSYVRPDKRVVNSRRDLSNEEDRIFGNILFPGRRGHIENEPQRTMTRQPSCSRSSSCPAPSSPPPASSHSSPTPSTSTHCNTHQRAGNEQLDRNIQHEVEINENEVSTYKTSGASSVKRQKIQLKLFLQRSNNCYICFVGACENDSALGG